MFLFYNPLRFGHPQLKTAAFSHLWTSRCIRMSAQQPVDCARVQEALRTEPSAADAVVASAQPNPDPAEPSQPAVAATATDQPPRRQHQHQQAPAREPPIPVVPPSLPSDISTWDNAVLLVDKPPTWTSFDVCGKLRGVLAPLLRRKAFKIKVGHAGTLDPMATGLLIVCVGRATKSIDSFVAMTKEYTGVLRLGEATASYDADSPVEETAPWEHVTDEALQAAATALTGTLHQLPPMYSAVRVGGKRLYESARAGQEVERKHREVTVEAFEVTRDPEDPRAVTFRVICSKGTYVRTLAHDLGKAVGSAAHLTALRREAIGVHRVTAAWEVRALVQGLGGRMKEDSKGAAGEGEGEAVKEQVAVTEGEAPTAVI
jgi:tRNA pseudouridine55 synthase